MKKMVLTGLILLALALHGAGAFELIKTIEMPADDFSVDIMGHVYWARGSTLYRYNPQNNETLEYTNTFLGEIHSWDASNPLKILAFHKEFNTLVFLDKNLSPLASPIRLDNMGVMQAGAACHSHQGSFWLANLSENRLQLYESNLSLMLESATIPTLGQTGVKKIKLRERNRNLYCLVPGCCLLQIDRYGNLARRHPLKNVDNIQILNQNIYYFYNGNLYRMDKDFQAKQQIQLPRPAQEWEQAKMGTQNRLYLLKDQKLYIYQT
jgi:hypothetical protein